MTRAEKDLAEIRKLLDRYWLANRPKGDHRLYPTGVGGYSEYSPAQIIDDIRRIVERPQ